MSNREPISRISHLARLGAWVGLASIILVHAAAGPVISEFSPQAGPAGTTILVSGLGFGTNSAVVTATVGATAATVVSVADDEVTLTVPATGGPVRIVVNGSPASSLLPFRLTHTISGTFNPPAGFDATGYYTGGISQSTDGNNFSAAVSADAVEVVWAWRDPRDPMFAALVHPNDSSVTMDAASTALALVALFPAMPKGDPAAIDEVLQRVSGSPELAALASLIATASAAGHGYLDDGRFAALHESLLTKALTPPAQGAQFAATLVPAGAGYVHPLELENAIAPRRLDYQLAVDPPVQKLTVSEAAANPTRLQQNLELWPVDPAWFADGFEKINHLSITDRPKLISDVPYARGFVSAKLGSANLDPGEWIGRAASWAIDGIADTASTDNVFSLPQTRNGVYVLNAFSGNVWFGSNSVDPGRSQAFLIGQIDPNDQWTRAFVSNAVITALDVAAIVLPDVAVIGKKPFGYLVNSLSTEVAKTASTYRATYGEINTAGTAQICKAAAIGAIKQVAGMLVTAATESTWRGFLGATVRLVASEFDALGKLSNGLQALERGASLITPTHYAVERAVIVVGDPFAPQIRSFTPAVAHAGENLLVYADPLQSNTTGLQFAFVTFAATGAPPPITARLPATIDTLGTGACRVRVPSSAEWEAAFGPGDHQVYLSLTSTTTGSETTTVSNPAPYAFFTYRAPPTLTAVTPDPARSGGVVAITGPGFDPLALGDFSIEIDGMNTANTFSASTDRLYVVLPTGLAVGSHSLRLLFRNSNYAIVATSNTVPFTVYDPNPPPPTAGRRTLHVTLADLSNSADGQLSLYEALALAGGTLGRNLQVRPDGVSGGHYESDWVDINSGGSYGNGVNFRDSIVINSNIPAGTVIAVNAPLPAPGNNDEVQLGGVILDGAGAPPDTVGWDLSGVTGSGLTSGTFRNFPGTGILLGAGARFNAIQSTTVEAPGGDGVALLDDASDNDLYVLTVHGAGGAGLRLSGANVTGNRLTSGLTGGLFGSPRPVFTVHDSGGDGVVVEAGARGNIVHVEVRTCGGDGIRVTGPGTDNNLFGWWLPGFKEDVAGATGHGVHVLAGASSNVFRNLAVSGSGGDGFRIEGPVTGREMIQSCATGFNWAAFGTAGFVAPNAGHSVLIQDSAWNTVGARGRDSGLNTTPNFFGGGSSGATILVTGAGAHHNVIDDSAFGFLDPTWIPNGSLPEQLLVPAATHAIQLTAGAHDNTIGSALRVARVSILGVPNGAAVLIEGDGTDGNQVFGTSIGLIRSDLPATGQDVRIGIHVRDGAAANRIGELGDVLGYYYETGASMPYNTISRTLEAGIRLENVAAQIDANGEPVDANQVVNNRLGSGSTYPEVALHLKGAVSGQWIGGPTQAYGNQVGRFGYAGLWIEGGVIADYAHRNRITSLTTDGAIGTSAASPNADPYAGPVSSQSLLISGGASGQVVGEDWMLPNFFTKGRVCAYVEGGARHWLRASRFDLGVRAAIFIHGGSDDRIGGPDPATRVVVIRSGTLNDDTTAGIVLAGGSRHRVEGVLIGDLGTVDTIWGSRGHGILLHDSAGNRIGGPARRSGNTIVRSSGDGIRIEGTGSTGNEIGSNRIGFGPLSASLANAGAGIQFLGGAHDNLVGGAQSPWDLPSAPGVPAPNTIRDNLGDGVLVTGGNTTGNRILSNSIVGNAGLGIRLTTTGNRDQPPPAVVTLADGFLSGHVADLAETPPGSTIEVFMNPTAPSPQGEVLLGGAPVAVNGTFRIAYPFLPPGGVLTATATNAVTGDTSQFTNAITLPANFGFLLATPIGEGMLTHPWPDGGNPFSAVVLTATTVSCEVEVTHLQVQANGAGRAALAGVSLFEDVDGDGVWSDADRQLGAVTAFDGSGVAGLDLTAARVRPDESRRWVLRLHRAAGVMPTGTVQLELTAAPAVTTRFWEPLGYGGVTAIFPLQSASFTASEVLEPWQSDPNADPDGDGLSNLLEHALGLDLNVTNTTGLPEAGTTATDWIYTYDRPADRTDITYEVEVSTNLTNWSTTGVTHVRIIEGAIETWQAKYPISEANVFFRLKVTQP